MQKNKIINHFKKYLFLLILIFCAIYFVSAQNTYSIKSFDIVISGTSTIHNWTAEVTKATGTFKYKDSKIDKVIITIDAQTLQSSKGSLMDKKMNNALKSDKFPSICYKSTSNTALSNTNNTYSVSSTGNFTISGVTNKSTQTAICKELKNGDIKITGNFSLLMSDYGITPPEAMFGTLVTADKVKINYSIIFKKTK